MGTGRGGGGGKSRPSPLPLEDKKKNFWLYWPGLCCYFFFILGPFCYVFSQFWGPFHHVGAFSLLFTSWGGGGVFFGLASPPPTKISAGAHDCKEGSRGFSPEIYLCDRNLVSSGHVLLRFCLKNDKNSDKLYLLGGFEGMLIRGKCW